MRISVRLNDEMKRRLADYAQRNGLSKSEVVRRAIYDLEKLDAAAKLAKRQTAKH